MQLRARSSLLVVPALFVLFGLAPLAAIEGQRSSSIVIHDTSTGRTAAKGLGDAIKSELASQYPCVEAMDDQDIADAMNDERERALIEGGDSQPVLTEIGNQLGSSLVMTVNSGPAGNNVAVLNTKSVSIIARASGSDTEGVAKSIVGSLGPYLANDCKPHWIGTINYVATFEESKTTNDNGPMLAAKRNIKRVLTQTANMTTTIKASLKKPGPDDKLNSPQARVMQRIISTFEKSSSMKGEDYCREPGKNPYWKGFAESYIDTTTMLGQGTDTMPVFISIDSDGTYSIKVTAPGGTMLGKNETMRTVSGCGHDEPEKTQNAVSLPEGRIESTSFDAEGRVDPKNKDVLSGSQTSPDGKTKITWSLRLVKPKGK
jgi:hypothetical protein